jgi:UDP-glucose 4-epimerase
MNVLVIGGAGFIGSNLIKALVKEGHRVLSIDNYLTGSLVNHHRGAQYREMCAYKINGLDFNADVVFHLGEYSRVEQSDIEPWKCLKNTYRTLPAVLEYCSMQDAKLIYSGSSTKFSEASNPYIIAKYLNTNLVQAICDQYGIRYAITYFYNVYGQNEISEGPYATVVAKFLNAHKQANEVVITGNGEQRRHFTHVDDIVDGLILVSDEGQGDGYGIGSDESFSIRELADLIGVKYQFAPDKPSNRKQSHLMTEKTEALGWKASRSLIDYINKKIGG